MSDELSGTPIDISAGRIRIRSLTKSDLPLMLKWLSDERVLEFYGGRDCEYDLESLTAHYAEPWDTKFYRAIIEYEGRPIGYCQVYKLDGDERNEYGYPETNETVFAADQFIGVPELWGKGIGTAYMETLLGYLTDTEHADVVLVDPHADNERAVRMYKKAGFQAVRILPEHELFEGRRVDCIMMEYRS